MSTIAYDGYLDNRALKAALASFAAEHPTLVELRELGRSYEDRPIPLVLLTNRETGPDDEKPAFWIDANIHATEVTGTMAALRVIDMVLERYGEDPMITRLVDEQVLYIAPRLNPDGASWALDGMPRYIRSGTRPYPFGDRQDGLHAEDLDGDGRILQMRIPDPCGDWKVSERNPRMMVKRGPFDEGGAYYRLFPEGMIEGFDGHTIPIAPPLQGLDFNRNFPNGWRPQGEQGGAGEYPGSEPEIQSLLRFVGDHPNIFGALTLHTFSRALLRPFSDRPDEEMSTDDLWVYEAIGEKGTERTGYPCVSVYHDFRYHPKQTISGAFDDWMYSHNGVFAFTVELWDLPSAAGVAHKNENKEFIEWWRKHPREDDDRILDFVLEHAPDSLVEWYAHEHPQLGRVELGGWENMYSWRNPPHALLEAEITPVAEFALDFASLGPKLDWYALDCEALADGHYRIVACVENRGFLSTSGSSRAREAQRARKVELSIELPEGCALVSGSERVDLGHLEGRSNKLGMTFGNSPTDNRGRAEWIVKTEASATLRIHAVSDRAGVLRRDVTLG